MIGRLYAQFAQRDHHVFIEFRDAHRFEHHLAKLPLAMPDPKHMIDEVKVNLEIATAPRNWRGRQSTRRHVKCDMP